MTYKIQTRYIPKDIPIINLHDNNHSLIDEYLRKVVKAQDDLVYSLFEEYGYSREEANELIKTGDIEGMRCVSSLESCITYYTFKAHGESLFIVMEKYDIEKRTFTLGYKKLKGENEC